MTKESKTSYMRDETFAELIESAKQALAYERAERNDYRVTRIERPVSAKTISAGKAIPLKSTRKYYRKRKNVPDKE